MTSVDGVENSCNACFAVQGRAVRDVAVGPCMVRGQVSRARVRRRRVACVSRAGRVRGAAAARSRTSICVHVDFFARRARRYSINQHTLYGALGMLSEQCAISY